MARGAAKQKTKSTAPITPARRPGTAGTQRKPKVTPGTNDMTMFFPRLRKQAKWVFVFLAVVFMLSFVFLGVGSGSTGIGDLFNSVSWFGGGNGGSSLSALGKTARKEPNNAQAQLDYAQELDTKGQSVLAIGVLQHFIKNHPKNVDVLSDLSSRYEQQAQSAATNGQNAQIEAASVSGSDIPSLTNTKGTPALGTDPIISAVTSKSTAAETKAQTQIQTAFINDERVLKALVKASPGDTTQVFRLAQAAANANDAATAIKNFKLYIKLAPDTPEVALAKQSLKQLQTPSAVSPVSGG